MNNMKPIDWKWLTAIANRTAETAPKAQLEKLLALSFVIARHRKDLFSLTGLGRDALLRYKYKIKLPEAEPIEMAQPVADADIDEAFEADVVIA